MKYIRAEYKNEEVTKKISFALSENNADKKVYYCDDESYTAIVNDPDMKLVSEEVIDVKTYFEATYEEMLEVVIFKTISIETHFGNSGMNFIKSMMLSSELSPIINGADKIANSIKQLGLEVTYPEIFTAIKNGVVEKTKFYDIAKEKKYLTEEELAPLYARVHNKDGEDCTKCDDPSCRGRKADYVAPTPSNEEKQEQEDLINSVKGNL